MLYLFIISNYVFCFTDMVCGVGSWMGRRTLLHCVRTSTPLQYNRPIRGNPANTTRRLSAGLTLGQRRLLWAQKLKD